jgi:hypothetical protein
MTKRPFDDEEKPDKRPSLPAFPKRRMVDEEASTNEAFARQGGRWRRSFGQGGVSQTRRLGG